MKRYLIPISCVLCALLLAACGLLGGGDAPEGIPCQLYFRESDLYDSAGGDIFRTETVYLEEDSDTQTQVETLLEALLEGPRSEFLSSVIPAGTSLLSAEVTGSRALVDFSAGYGALSGVRLTMADYAVTLTLTQLPDIAVVRITVQGQELAYRDRQLFTARDVMLSSEEDVVGTVEAGLYFLNQDGVLTEEWQTLDLYEGDTQVMAVVRALERGPETRDLSASLPENFRIKTIWLEEDTCYVNLSSAQLRQVESRVPLDTCLQALRQSLCTLDTVTEVRFLVDGELTDPYSGEEPPVQGEDEPPEKPKN